MAILEGIGDIIMHQGTRKPRVNLFISAHNSLRIG